ncbi:response regulator [Conexibacter arvalis]|uniref:DNA-binding NarL/FixJ family response regulator n=1 Tax=Conexibacter arvalis TaxID=912552 RepID=A0A840IJ53_9ACTN|nr:DNA-binding NarL/FixJ family response regulator [Conexibacter arvalis]
MSDPLRVLLAERQPITRLGIRMALERDGITSVVEASDAAGALACARQCQVDVCLLDVGLPGGALAAVAAIAAAAPRTRVIMLAARRADDELIAALRAGAIGYLLKDIGPDELVRAVHGAVHGEAPLSSELTARIVEELQTRSGARRVRAADGAVVTLSPREASVLELLRRGLTTKQVADRLGLSPVTVRRHVSATAHRLGVGDRDAALRLTREASPP